MTIRRRLFVFTAASALLGACGYRVAGRGDNLPRTLRTIAVPAFANLTPHYRLSHLLARDVTREFLSRTRYQIVENPEVADAVLTGAVVNSFAYPIVNDPISGRATGIQIIIILQVSLRERATGRELYAQQNLEFRERYELALDEASFFQEGSMALTRLSRDVARTIVSNVLESF